MENESETCGDAEIEQRAQRAVDENDRLHQFVAILTSGESAGLTITQQYLLGRVLLLNTDIDSRAICVDRQCPQDVLDLTILLERQNAVLRALRRASEAAVTFGRQFASN